jgi:hypothetical protein
VIDMLDTRSPPSLFHADFESVSVANCLERNLRGCDFDLPAWFVVWSCQRWVKHAAAASTAECCLSMGRGPLFLSAVADDLHASFEVIDPDRDTASLCFRPSPFLNLVCGKVRTDKKVFSMKHPTAA